MTEENQMLRDKLQSIERIVTTALASQPHGDEECGEHLRKALSDISKEVGFELFGNAAAMREALLNLRDGELAFCEKNADKGIGLSAFGLQQHCMIMSGIIDSALSEPTRNCDLCKTVADVEPNFMTWCKNHKCETCPFNEDGSDSCYASWLLAPVTEKGGRGGRK